MADIALIGSTGFVGENLQTQTAFSHFYNSKNIRDMRGRDFELVVCAGNSGAKWLVDKDPDHDLENIEYLMSVLRVVNAERFILISTVDVHQEPWNVDEDSRIELKGLHAYGTHRFWLEQYVNDRFNAHVVRLPKLFGPGLKRNVVYDFLHHNQIENIHQAGL